MEKFLLTDYVNGDAKTKRVLESLVEDACLNTTPGMKYSYDYVNGDMSKLIMNTYKGYLGEVEVLKYLIRMQPHAKWKFNDENAGYFQLKFKPNNKPDFINKFGKTAEAKCYSMDNNQVVFKSYAGPENVWKDFFHNADTVYVYDKHTGNIAGFNEKEFFDCAYVKYDKYYYYKLFFEIFPKIKSN